MTNKITYLFGAGASYPELPLALDNPGRHISGIPAALCKMAGKYEFAIRDGRCPKEIESLVTHLITDFRNAAKLIRQYHNVESLAEHYYQTNRKNLQWFKQTLARYFMLEQFGIDFIPKKNKHFPSIRINNRYHRFVSTIMQQRKSIPDNIRMLSWNLDFQMELAAFEYYRTTAGINGSPHLQDERVIGYYPGPDIFATSTRQDTHLLHLNGIAGMVSSNTGELIIMFMANQEDINNTELMIKQIFLLTNQPGQLITFPWETTHLAKKTMDTAKNIIEGTDILVVVGYSFPIYNRPTDKTLFETLCKNDRLKIYYQDPVLDGSFLKTRFNLGSETTIRHIRNVNRFFIPLEFEKPETDNDKSRGFIPHPATHNPIKKDWHYYNYYG